MIEIRGYSLHRETENIERIVAAHGIIDPQDVNCLTLYGKGFAYAILNVLHVFEKENNYKYSKKTRITIPVDIFPARLYHIANVAINTQMDTVIVTAAHSQIYIGMLVVPETLKVKDLQFKILGEPLHIDSVVSMSVCSWKSIVMTACKRGGHVLDIAHHISNFNCGPIFAMRRRQPRIRRFASGTTRVAKWNW